MSDQRKQLLFSVTLKDCEVQTFRSGGKGGQNQNKVESGVRIIHHPSGARGECRETRDQIVNKRRAFLRMIETPQFKFWHKLECARRMGQRLPEEIVEAIMSDSSQFKVEVKDACGRWVEQEKGVAATSVG